MLYSPLISFTIFLFAILFYKDIKTTERVLFENIDLPL